MQVGQVGQPRPESVSRTAPPVTMMPMFATNAAKQVQVRIAGVVRQARTRPRRPVGPVAGSLTVGAVGGTGERLPGGGLAGPEAERGVTVVEAAAMLERLAAASA